MFHGSRQLRRLMLKIKANFFSNATSIQGFALVDVISSIGSSKQKAYFHASQNKKKMPLVVHLHEWTFGYEIFPVRSELGILCKKAGFNYIFPDFCGSNNTPESCASEKAIVDIDNAIDFAIEKGNVDADNIVIVGQSGGGHAALAMYMKSRHRIKYFSVWCPISDIERWYYQTKNAGLRYCKDIEKVVEGSQNIAEMKNRSPLYMDFGEGVDRKDAKLELYHGINDGYSGSVLCLHSFWFYNKINEDSISCPEILNVVSRSIPNNSTEFIGDRKLLYEKKNGNVCLSIFDGTHEILMEYAFGHIKSLTTAGE